MKVILAGYSKTGTTSMAAALTELGYIVHDFGEHVLFCQKKWMKILLHGDEKEDFIEMYEDVDAVGNAPPAQYWYQIHQAFPEAKIILTTREEDSFIESYKKQLKVEFGGHKYYQILQTFTPTGWGYFQIAKETYKTWLAFFVSSPWDKPKFNETAVRRLYRMHNQDVILNAPKDKLLVFNVKEGWEKLCKFLNKDIPDVPFPHKNARSSNIEGRIKTHPLFHKMKMEFYWFLAIVVPLVLLILCFTINFLLRFF